MRKKPASRASSGPSVSHENLDPEEFQHILTTFPLVDQSVKSQTLNTYRDLLKLGKLPDKGARK